VTTPASGSPPVRRATLREHLRVPLHVNALALATSAGLTAVLGLLYWAVAARRYTAAEVGTQSALISAMLLVGGMAQIGADSLLIRFLPVAGRNGRRLAARLYGIAACAGICAAVAFAAGTTVWSPALRFLWTNHWWLVVFALSTVVACLYAVQDSVLTGARRAPWVPLENGLVSLLKIVLLAVFAAFAGSKGIFASWNVPTSLAVLIVTVLVFTRLLPRRGTVEGNLPPRRALARYMVGNYVASLFALASINATPLIVITRLGAESAAHFFVPWAIFNGLQLFATAISYSLIVEAAANEKETVPLFRRAIIHTLATLTPLAALVALVGPTVLRVLGSSYALGGGPLLRWLAVAAVPAVAIPLSITLARLQNRPALVIAIQASWSLLILGGSYVALGRTQLEGVGVVALATATTLALVLSLTVLRPVLRARPQP
jgi:O-antigen/teichoic acid export membrane protein